MILNVVVKTARDARALIAPVRGVLKDIDPLKPAQGLYPLEDLVAATYARDRQIMITLSIFGAAATLLAVLNIYGVLSQRVRERSREIGIRMALGANTPNVIGWVAGSGLRLMALGLAIGAIAARGVGGALGGLLVGVAATDVVSTLAAAAVLALIGAIAMVGPAWRATRVDPMMALRAE